MQLISVVLPVYNAAPFLEQCFDSVLSQEGTAFELLVVDDGSTDGSGDICARYAGRDSRIRLFRMESGSEPGSNAGPGAAKNFALLRARGGAAAFIDADDYFEPDALRTLAAAWRESGADFVRCENRIFCDDAYPPPRLSGLSLSGPRQGKMPRDGLIDIVDVEGGPRVRYWSPCGSSLVSLDAVRRHGVRFSEKMRQGEDSRFMLELARGSASYHYCDVVVYNWRRHGYNSITLTSLNPLERVACKFFFYAELRKYLRERFGEPLGDRSLAHNYASVFVEMLLLYGAWGADGDCIAGAMAEPLFQESLPDFTPAGWRELCAKAFAQLGWARALAVLGREFCAEAVAGWSDFSGFDYERVVGADYS